MSVLYRLKLRLHVWLIGLPDDKVVFTSEFAQKLGLTLQFDLLFMQVFRIVGELALVFLID